MRFLFAFTFAFTFAFFGAFFGASGALASTGLTLTPAEANCDIALFAESFLPPGSLSAVEQKGYRVQVYAGAVSLGSLVHLEEGQSVAVLSKGPIHSNTQGCSLHLQVGVVHNSQEVEVPTSALGMGAVTQVIRRISANWFFELQFQNESCSEAAVLQALSALPECQWMQTQRTLLHLPR